MRLLHPLPLLSAAARHERAMAIRFAAFGERRMGPFSSNLLTGLRYRATTLLPMATTHAPHGSRPRSLLIPALTSGLLPILRCSRLLLFRLRSSQQRPSRSLSRCPTPRTARRSSMRVVTTELRVVATETPTIQWYLHRSWSGPHFKRRGSANAQSERTFFRRPLLSVSTA